MSSDNNYFEDDLAILGEFVDEAETDLDTVAGCFIKLESAPEDLELLNAIFRPIHSIKGNSAFLGLMQVRQLAHDMESLMDDLRKQRARADAGIISALLSGVDALKAILARIRLQEPEVADAAAFQALMAKIKQARGVAGTDAASVAPPAPGSVPSPAPAAASSPVAAEADVPAREIGRSLRVAEKHLDELQRLQATLAQLQQKAAVPSADPARMLQAVATVLAQVAEALDRQLAAIRSVTAGDLLQRAPRIARETALALGKTVQVELRGEDLRLPKSVMAVLETPLMHMVRNSVDHGIEAPEARQRAGKPSAGRLTVELREESQAYILRVADDGAGIDFKALLAKAMTQGLCPRDRALKPEDVMNLIFLPGISSARKVTDISGRGVGMDVVKNQVEGAGGTIQVASKTGKGTEFNVRLPRG